jgi:hypothetical protein
MRVRSARTGGHHAEKLKPSTSTSVASVFEARGLRSGRTGGH